MVFKNRNSYILNFAVILALLGGMFGVVPARASAVIRYVKWNASGANNGTSWANAYTDLQSAISDAFSGDEFWVAAGTYKPTTGVDRTISFTLKNEVAVYGGFAGTETLLTQRNPAANVTVLSGNIGVAGNSSDNSYHVVIGSGTYNTTVLDGFTVTAGNANGPAPNNFGGGMYNINGANLKLSNLLFSNNSASGAGGGGMFILESSPDLTNVTFSGNSASGVGGGIYNQDGIFTLTNVIFSNNSAGEGGGIYNDHGYPNMQNVTFNENSASYGGGIYSKYWTSPSLTNVTFINNSADYDGGGMYNYTESNPIMTNVTFSGNSADKGAGIYNYQGHPVLNDVTFNDNSATFGGGMYNYYYSDPTLTDVIFSNNSATSGGGMYNDVSGPSLTNVTFDGNSATDGGGMYNITNDVRIPLLKNVTFINNTATERGGGMYNNNSNPSLTHVTFSGNSAYGGGGMLNTSGSSPILMDVTFNGNSTTGGDGGGMYNEANSNLSLTNVTFSINTAVEGGGMFNLFSSPSLTNVTFSGNQASYNGGGMFNGNSDPSLIDTVFTNNFADFGGGIYNYSSSNPTLTHMTLNNNIADVHGGGIYNWESDPALTDVTLSNNIAEFYGGGIYNWESDPTLINVTLSGNLAHTSGGGIANDSSSPNIINSIMYGDIGGEIYNFSSSSSPTVTYSIVQGGYSGTGNLNVNPLLGPLADNGGFTQTMALRAGSPAIDAGDDTTCPATDQRGVERPQGDACDMGAYEYEPIVSVGVTIGESNVGNYDVGSEQSVSDDYGINGGPVLVSSTDGTSPIFTSQRAIFGSSFNSIVGYPADQLTTDYWFTSYDDVGMLTYLVIGNPHATLTAQVDVYIGGIKRNATPYSIAPGQRIFPRYGINAGPVHVVSTNGVAIFTSERTKFGNSFNEVMGYPGNQLTTDYWFTSYDDLGMTTYLVIGNPHPSNTAEVDVYINGIKKNNTPYAIAPGQRIFPRYAVNAGPVHVVSTNGVDIFTSERSKFGQSFNEVLGYPGDQLSTDYWFTSYDDASMITYLVIGNPDPTLTAEVDVYINGVKKNLTPYVIAPGQRVFPRYAINAGPVHVVSTNGVDIFTSERAKYLSSFNEILGLPDNQLTTDYWFTSYDDASMITYLVIGNPHASLTAEVDVYINGIKKNTVPYSIAPGQRVFPRYAINQGPVHVVSTNGVDIFTSERAKYLNSFNEILGLPDNQLTTDYWFTSYDDVGMITNLVIAAP